MKTSQSRSTVIDLDDEQPAPAGTPVLDEAGAPSSDVVDEDGGVAKLPKGATRNPDGSVTLKLLYPVMLQIRSSTGSVREETYAELKFHRLTGADMRAISAASRESSVVVAFARSTRTREAIMSAVFDKMDGADIEAGGLVIDGFFGSGQKTGR